jgi:iron transport multicopper oxidase
MRLVSLSCDPNYTFSIDGHTMTIIEVDGVAHQPLAVDSIQIFAGRPFLPLQLGYILIGFFL